MHTPAVRMNYYTSEVAKTSTARLIYQDKDKKGENNRISQNSQYNIETCWYQGYKAITERQNIFLYCFMNDEHEARYWQLAQHVYLNIKSSADKTHSNFIKLFFGKLQVCWRNSVWCWFKQHFIHFKSDICAIIMSLTLGACNKNLLKSVEISIWNWGELCT